MQKLIYKYVPDDHSIYVKRVGLDRSFSKLDGEFYVGKANELFYKFATSNSLRKEYGLAGKIILNGNWMLDNENRLIFNLQKHAEWSSSQKILFKTSLVTNKVNALVLLVNLSDTKPIKFGTITLRGKWLLDSKNRLNFLLSHSNETSNLRFNGQWRINKNNILSFDYMIDRGNSKKEKQIICWQGVWEINKLKRLVYKIKGSSESLLEFKVSIESNSIRAKDNAIKFRFGAMINDYNTFTLFGTWKLYKSGVVDFIIKSSGTKRKLRFNVKKILSSGSEVMLSISLQDQPWFKLSFDKKFADKNVLFKANFKHLIKSWQVEGKYQFIF